MSFSRAFHNLVVLPNGEVFVAGGNSSGTKFSDAGGILPAEMWNPTTGLWRTLPSMAEPRGYHFLAILLRDGRVWAGGGGLCGCVADHLNGQIYSPGYLFNADGSAANRPQINLAPNDLKPGLTIGVTGSDDITGFRLIRLQATTHGYNSDQRYVPVTHTKTGTGSYSLTLDSSQDVLVPGGYWLFAVNANGTPSIGYNVQVYTTATWPGGAGGETNLAIGKSATQSSTASGGVAARAVDGNTNGDFSQNSVIQTNSQSQPFWQVDLGARAQIANVKIWNRSDCCAANLTNFHVFVSDQPFTGTTVAQSQAQAGVTDIPHSGTAGATVTLAVNRSARYLRVQLEGTAALNFAEFEAMGIVITNNPPSVSITSPAPGTSVPAPGSFTIAANASDPENNLSKVEFYNGATKLGEDLVAPYSFVWSGIAAGNYTITVRAIDTQGLFTDASVNVSVTSAGNAAPTVSIVSPLSGAMFTAAADVVFNVTAADPDNNLQKVELFNGAVKVGELTAAPFTFTVLNLAAGTYSFSARATDFPGLSATAAITIRVVNRQIQSLRGVPVPDPAAINSYIKNRPAAVALGKALFWDMQVSSDGAVACASCHFHAGADLRLKNQMNPGTLRTGTPPMTFDNSRTGSPNGPNYTTVAGDFPRHVLTDPANPNSAVVYTSKDVLGSHGQFLRNYTSATAGAIADACAIAPDPIFGAARRSTGRNTPPVINAIFNVRNFWDGRANSIFNGVDSFGPRNTNARIYRGNPPVALAVSLDNASLASQAVAAPLNSSEMSCAGRTWPEIAKRLLAASALARQNVLTTDSVLGSYSRGAALKGLNKTYLELVQAAFADDLHTSPTAVNIGGTNYTQAQANFSLFFGLALQLYQATLVSDQAPIDTYFAPYPSASVETASALTPEQITGLNVFNGKGRCASCHHGPQLTNAATPAREANAFGALISKMLMGNGSPATYDIGYYNIGVRRTSEDLGIGGVDPFGNPLSITRQIKAGANVDGISIDPCTFAVEPCLPLNATSRDAVDGAFKTPSLRNVSLTGPYFHNGSLATLEEVVDFYNRGGDATTIAGGDSTGFGPNSSNSHPDIGPLALTAIEKQSLVTFLKTALLDTRVQFERAPFDHPELPLLNAGNEFVLVPAVGSTGRATPLPAFADVLAAGGLGYSIVTPATPPTVAITAPVNGSAFTAPANVTVTATATPASGTIAKVDFFTGASLIASVSTAPYTTTLSSLPAGAYTITATATDSNGASSSVAVSFTVGTLVPPSVSITAPANNASFVAPASVTINANATTTQGTITQVEFYNGATLLGTDTTSPYSFAWSNVAAGNYTLTARAIGSNGVSSASAPVTITVTTVAVPVALGRWPLDTVSAGSSPNLSASNNPLLITGPYTLTPGQIGQAIQFDAASSVARTQSQVIDPSQSFTVSAWVKLTSVAGTQTFVSQSGTAVSSFYLQLGGWLRGRFTFDLYPSDSTNAVDAVVDGSTVPQPGVWYHVAGVHNATAKTIRIYVNGVLEGETPAPLGGFVSNAPLTFGHAIWSGARADGTAAAIDDVRAFNSALTATDVLGVYNDRNSVAGPSISIVAPSNNASFVAPACVTIDANATTTQGTVTQVEFYNGATLLNTDTTAPYSFNWANVAAGNYTLTAKAIGSNGTSTTSAPIAIVVTAPVPPSVSITAPANNASFVAPASVTIDANATTTQGTITQVEFYNGATLLNTDTTAPYSFPW
ncbi:MAG: DUF1929 domain-containing protein, partial [Acidobacteria bacterium]|nr:DUF1929 domain-containing protein [Acidobacteriota bacterium]